MTASAAQHGVIGTRRWEGRKPGLFASICQAYLTPEVVIRAAALLKTAAATIAVAAPGSRYIDRVARARLPMYLTVLGRWTEVLEFWKNSSEFELAAATPSASAYPQPPLPPWPVRMRIGLCGARS